MARLKSKLHFSSVSCGPITLHIVLTFLVLISINQGFNERAALFKMSQICGILLELSALHFRQGDNRSESGLGRKLTLSFSCYIFFSFYGKYA